MATIKFKAKIKTVYSVHGDVLYTYLKVPVFNIRHCDMPAFRQHKKYGSYANSTLFPGMLSRIRNEYFPRGVLRLDNIPDGVEVASGFLTTVEINV